MSFVWRIIKQLASGLIQGLVAYILLVQIPVGIAYVALSAVDAEIQCFVGLSILFTIGGILVPTLGYLEENHPKLLNNLPLKG